MSLKFTTYFAVGRTPVDGAATSPTAYIAVANKCDVPEVHYISRCGADALVRAGPAIAAAPGPALAKTLKAEADEGVVRGPGNRPTCRLFQCTSETGH